VTPADRRLALELEFERLKQRADYLDRMLHGHPETWAGIQALIPDGTEVIIDKMVSEARQTASTMATILRTLDGSKPVEAPVPVADPLQAIKDDLAARRNRKTS
jgi:hypothetical protein